MYVTIESLFCSYCDEVAEIFLRLIDTILLASDENELRQGIENLKTKVLFDDYFVYGFGAHHFWCTSARSATRRSSSETDY